jgi:hypothetical protein
MQGAVGADGRVNGRGSHTVAPRELRPAAQAFIAEQCSRLRGLVPNMSTRVDCSFSSYFSRRWRWEMADIESKAKLRFLEQPLSRVGRS